MRCFIALDFSEKAKHELYNAVKKPLLGLKGPYKAVEERNLHITMHFFGELTEKEAEQPAQLIQSFYFNPFVITFSRKIGMFLHRDRGFPLFLEPLEGRDKVQELYLKLMKALFLRTEKFTPHLTVARVKVGFAREENLGLTGLAEDITVTAERLILYKSELTAAGPVYAALAETGKK